MSDETHAGGMHLTVLLSSTRRGARLARLLTVAELASRGLPTDPAAHVVGELAANAALHGRVPGRSFRLRASCPEPGSLLIEVTDALGERAPRPASRAVGPDAESGRGLLLVEALAERWGVTHGPFPCKTVWAEVSLTPSPRPTGSRSIATRYARAAAARREPEAHG
ncbi:ATP-binding protein [Streptomyces tubbatahanensis]|uniref:ATP-binding protein n=1 Tax=Streptomyces tubbatahanensis TaxID=2923272 RepID=A0ABY3XVL9_9ACTN|nr:ATP-binding protein [Streptomyces tubbatahanensis]UNS98425.1 ATP-binding protein [Streptomyces tubbatahanensis]